jgi:hypothetical protein
MFDHALAFPDILVEAVQDRLRSEAIARKEDLTSYPPGVEEVSVLESWLGYKIDGITDARMAAILDYVWSVPRRRKVVVFANFTNTAERLSKALAELLAEGQVVTHLENSSTAEGEAALRRFREERGCNVLVCDSSAEEGLNLQFADIVVRWDERQAQHERLVCSGKGHLRFVRQPYYEDEAVYSYWASDAQRGGEPLIPVRDLTDFMLGTLSDADSVRWGSHDRGAALRHPGKRLWGAGDPFLDGLLRYVRERDDRGRAYAFWKHQRDLEEGEIIAALRLDVIVQPGDISAEGLSREEQSALWRRMLGLLPPFVETVWLGPELEEISDPKTVRALASKYSPAFRDKHLTARHWGIVEEALPGLDWDAWCTGAFDVAHRIIRDKSSFCERTRSACTAAERMSLARIEALRDRQRLNPDARATVAFEERAATYIQTAVERPQLVVDAMGLVIVSGEAPKGNQ